MATELAASAAPASTEDTKAQSPPSTGDVSAPTTTSDDAAAAAAGPAGDFDPSADFKGDLDVSQKLPTKEDLEKCADLVVLDVDGKSRPFKTIYSGEGAAQRQLIVFVRHFFCGNCQEYLRTLCASITPESLLSLPTPTFLTIVGCGRPELIRMYAETTNCPFPIFADPTTKLYANLGMTRTLSLGPKKPDYIKTGLLQTTMHSIFQTIKSGRGAVQGGDIRQVGGEMLWEDGKVVWAHRMKNTRDHAEVEVLRRVLGLDGVGVDRRRSGGFRDMARRSVSWGRRSTSGPSEEAKESVQEEGVAAPAAQTTPAQTA